MDGDQASTHSAQGLPTCRRRWGLHLNTRLPSLQAGPRHGSQRATIHHDSTVGGFAASQVLAAVCSLIQDLANVISPIQDLANASPASLDTRSCKLLDTRPSRQHSVKWLIIDCIEASCLWKDCCTLQDQSIPTVFHHQTCPQISPVNTGKP